MLNICDFGAVGDGQTDNTKSIQTALDKAAEIKASVFVPEGVYLTSTLRMPPHTGLIGNPTWSFRKMGGSILQLNDPNAECLIDLTAGQGATLNGLCLDGQLLGKEIHGIMVDNEEYGNYAEENTFRVERCRIDGFTGNGAYLRRVWCFSIRHNMLSHNDGDGVWLQGWDGFLLDNWLTGNKGCGFGAYEKTASVTFTGNRIEWNHKAGLKLCGGNHYNITGNYFDRQGGPGLDIKDREGFSTSQVSVVGNTFARNGKPSRCGNGSYDSAQIRCRNAQGLVITSNIFEAWMDDPNSDSTDGVSPEYGIVFEGLQECVIKDNVLLRGATREILVDLGGHGPQVIVKDNVGSLYTSDNPHLKELSHAPAELV